MESTKQNWKDHPVVVAALSSAATFSLTVFAFKEVVIPTQIADINSKIRDLPVLEQTAESLRNTLKAKNVEISELTRQVEALQQKGLFQQGTPYPADYTQPKIGQPIDNLAKSYPNWRIIRESSSWSLEPEHGLFDRITYFFDETQKAKPITHILFQLDPMKNLSNNFMVDRLNATFGPPIIQKETFFSWKVEQFQIYKTSEQSFLIMPKKYQPGYWPD